MVSLCHSLEAAHTVDRWASSDPDPIFIAQSNCSRRLREAIMFSTCGSFAANKIEIHDPRDFDDPRKKTMNTKYVKRYIDGWTEGGTPSMWRSRNWRKH